MFHCQHSVLIHNVCKLNSLGRVKVHANGKTFVLPSRLKIGLSRAVHFPFKLPSGYLQLDSDEHSDIKHEEVRDKHEIIPLDRLQLRGICEFQYPVESLATETPVSLAVFKSHFKIQAIPTPAHKHHLLHHT